MAGSNDLLKAILGAELARAFAEGKINQRDYAAATALLATLDDGAFSQEDIAQFYIILRGGGGSVPPQPPSGDGLAAVVAQVNDLAARLHLLTGRVTAIEVEIGEVPPQVPPSNPPVIDPPPGLPAPFQSTEGMRPVYSLTGPHDWGQQLAVGPLAFAGMVSAFRVRLRVQVGERHSDRIENFIYLVRDHKRDRAKGNKPGDVLAQVDIMRGGNWAVRQRIGPSQDLEAIGPHADVANRTIEVDLRHTTGGTVSLVVDGRSICQGQAAPQLGIEGRVWPIFGSGPDEGFPHTANDGWLIVAALVEFAT